MKRFYELVFWLFIPCLFYALGRSFFDYGTTWHFDAWCLPETISNPADPFDSLNAAGRMLEKPLWVAIYFVLLLCVAMAGQLILSDQARGKRRAIFDTFKQQSNEIGELPDSLQPALRRQNLTWLKRRLGRRYWNRYHAHFEPYD